LCDSSQRPDWNGAAAVSSTGIPAVAERTAASTQPDEITGATDAKDASPHSGRFDRQRAGSAREPA
jgi:hypothetical protein